jgi:hypothetical protein
MGVTVFRVGLVTWMFRVEQQAVNQMLDKGRVPEQQRLVRVADAAAQQRAAVALGQAPDLTERARADDPAGR